MEQPKKQWKSVGIVLSVLLLVAVAIWLMPWFISMSDAEVRETFREKIVGMGWRGVAMMLGLQVLQVVVAVLPGAAVELLAGATYGAFGGLILCLVGGLAGTVLIFFTVRALGGGVVDRLFQKEGGKVLGLLKNTKKLEMLTFLLFFIPGTPKDLLTYVAPLTKLRAADFFAISTIARIPAIITTTYLGDAIMEGRWWMAAGLFVLLGIVGLAGVWYYNTLMEKQGKR